ncbi:polymer-forming cytoskeletal protein [Thermodesulfovibrionales bacterium]|nr:polymer-forming cytoskeletal protein [Thermodesulfovibrionales bacterium]MCL0035310.1 polymer-forming cytoskeletal protein [Thermodesulfovibrionales bacterium]MCL0083018.1 polymer-forming cytoskeletal protein [Thermodesulfovibrionales bacterium]MCL0084979.1 polymer-forming cytoskeletal protein [Thermodesulfovibrionales bacterium]
MFLKKTTANKLDILIGEGSEIEGNINTPGTMRIDGMVTGNVRAGRVVLGKIAVLVGDVVAKSVVIGGRVEGNIAAEEFVDIKDTGKLFGDINSKRVSIIEGGVFVGRSFVQRDEPKTIDLTDKKLLERPEIRKLSE